jgi:ElaB/YqjD/DUF883 family membrane-anchored ribosome-binding protein
MDPNQALAWSESVKRPLEEARHASDEGCKEARQAVVDRRHAIGPVQHSLEQAIVEHPVKAVGLSLALGVFLGWLIKR